MIKSYHLNLILYSINGALGFFNFIHTILKIKRQQVDINKYETFILNINVSPIYSTMGAWYTKTNRYTKIFLESPLEDDINDIIFCIGIIKASNRYKSIEKRIEIINNILLEIENKLYLDPTDMHDLHILLVYRKPEIKSFYTAKNEADLLDYWDRITNALIRIESNITENDYTYYNTFVGIREEIMKIHQSYGGKC